MSTDGQTGTEQQQTTVDAEAGIVEAEQGEVNGYGFAEEEEKRWENAVYFQEYAAMGIHVDMLGDAQRNLAYAKAIQQNAKFHFENKVVLDVGAGTGFLSCLAAKAGAKKVYAVEASEMYVRMEIIVWKNSLQDRIQIINERMETVQLPEKVDVIISEWMGCYLFRESMLESVLLARDRWLKEDGVMYPRWAKLYMAPITKWKTFENIKLLANLHVTAGIDMSTLIPFAYEELSENAFRSTEVHPEQLLQPLTPLEICLVDLSTVTLPEVRKFISPFHFVVHPLATVNSSDFVEFHGFTFWFEVIFAEAENVSVDNPDNVVLSTSPLKPLTHWGQDVFLFEPVSLPVGQNSEIKGLVRLTRSESWKRHFKFDFSFSVLKKHFFKDFLV